MLLSLTVIAVVAGGVLGLVSKVTAEPIAKAEKAKKEAAIKAVLPEFDKLEAKTIDGAECNYAFDAQGQPVGVAIESGSDKGFGGHLGVMVGFDNEGTITGYQIVQTAETPGLGAKAGEWFQKEGKAPVIGLNPAEPLKVKKDGGSIDAISGSTITSRAFCESINNAYAVFKSGNTNAAVVEEAAQDENVEIEETESQKGGNE